MKYNLLLITLLFYSGFIIAEESKQLADEIETPDALLKETQPEQKQRRYGDEFRISPKDVVKDKSQVTPDLLERSVQTEKVLSDKEFEQKEAVRIKAAKKKYKGDAEAVKKRRQALESDDIETPDPLLDSTD